MACAGLSLQEKIVMASDSAVAYQYEEPDWGDKPGQQVPYDWRLPCAQAPNPPGALGTTPCCNRPTEYFRQRWYCVWAPVAVPDQVNEVLDGAPPHGQSQQCGYHKVWRCAWEPVLHRCEVVAAMRAARRPPCCPATGAGDAKQTDCWIPNDQYFAKIWDVEYEECDPWTDRDVPDCTIDGEDPEKPSGCACCGVYPKLVHRIVRIRSKADIPPTFPACAATACDILPASKPVPWKISCQGAMCRPGRAKSPNLAYTYPFA